MNPLVSVIIPTFNGKKTLRMVVQSVLNQTYDNIEIIVVDDNGLNTPSQIETAECLTDYIASKKIQYYPEPQNTNASVARNIGFKMSKGDFISFLDDDDFLKPCKIEKQMSLFSKTDCSMVSCGSYLVDERGYGYKSVPRKTNCFLRMYLEDKIKFNTSTLLIKRTVVDSVGGFNESFRRHQDWEFCTRILCQGFSLNFVEEPLVVKFGLKRNISSNARIAEQYFDHFLEHVSSFINKTFPMELSHIQNYHKRRILLAFLKERNIRNILEYSKRKKVSICDFFISITMFFSRILQKSCKGSKKRTESLADYISKAEVKL